VIVRIVRFKSGLSDAEVLAAFEARSPRYRDVPGLRQKYYLRYPETGEHGAVYVWESREALEAFNRSDLGRSISDVYRVGGTRRGETAEVVLALRGQDGASMR
jgi:heme-degrading monooxygenase HmoA